MNLLMEHQRGRRWGRSAVLHLTNFIYIIFTVAAMFVADNYYLFVSLIAIGSTFPPLGIRIAYTLVAEYCNDRGRSLLYISGWVWWVAGAAFLSFIAWASQNWFVYGIAVPLCNLVFIPFIWLTPESPRLLLTQGKIIRDIIRINKKEVPENFDKELEDIAKQISEEQIFGILTLFKRKRMAYYTFLMSVTWIVNDFLYVGGQMNVENLAGNQFVNFALVASTELPSVFVGEFFINRYGRRWSHVFCMTVTTAFFICAIILSAIGGFEGIVTGMAICARTVGNIGWFIMWVQSVEIFPTCVRVSGMNFAAMMANVVTTTTPYVVLLGSSDLQSMYSVFACVGIVGIIVTLLLPETFQEPLPECLEDVNDRKQHPFFSWKVWINPEAEKKMAEY